MIKCPNCSAELNYDLNSHMITCSYCGCSFSPSELRTKINYAGEQEQEELDQNNSYEGKSYTCSQCGAALITFDETAITFCSYCGSQAILESKMIRINNPDYVIPFQKTKEECIKNYKKKIRKSIFAPSNMKSDVVIQKFRGIYMPYVVYDIEFHGDYNAKGSKRRGQRGDYIYYDDYDVVTNIDASYDGISYDLISKYYDKYSQMIPFNFKEAKEFNINYLSGFYADTRDVNKNTYDLIVKDMVSNECNPKLLKLKEYKKFQFEKIGIPFVIKDRKTGIFPIYFLSVRDKKNEHISYAIVNGQTGKVATDVPIDFTKYIILTFVISILIFLLIDNNLLFLPSTILKLSMLASLISLIISNRQLNKLNYKKQHLDDLGFI